MKPHINVLTVLLLSLTLNVAYADSRSSRPDSHAPIGVMGDHAHKAGEVMLSYRFMAMDMQGLQSGTAPLETSDVLKNFMTTPTQMGMQMHAIGAMFAPHNRITFMAISSNLMVPSGNPLAGQRLAVEFQMPIYQNLTGTQLKNRWRLILGWQYAFRL